MTDLTAFNKVEITSLEIAEITDKRHDHVLRDIRKMLDELEIEATRFWGPYKMPSGQVTVVYTLPKIEATCLASGYNVKLRMSIIKRLDELEKNGLNKPVALPNFNDPAEAARAWADQFEKKEKAESKILELEPKAEYFEAIELDKNSLPISVWAKELNMPPNLTFAALREMKYIFKKAGENFPYQKYINSGWLESRRLKNNYDFLSSQVLITPLGQLKLADKVINYFKQER